MTKYLNDAAMEAVVGGLVAEITPDNPNADPVTVTVGATATLFFELLTPAPLSKDHPYINPYGNGLAGSTNGDGLGIPGIKISILAP